MTVLSAKEKIAATLLTNREVLALAHRADREAKLSGLMAAAAITALVISPPLTLGFSIAASLGIGASLENFARAKAFEEIAKEKEKWTSSGENGASLVSPALSTETLGDRARFAQNKMNKVYPLANPSPGM